MTIGEIAKLAGVAKSTVSRYLNGGSVGVATRLKLERVIKETGYVPNTFARSLKAKKTNIIGTIVPRLNSYAATQTLIGIDEELREQGYQLLISNTSQNLDREIESIYSLENQKIAGIILLATQITDEHLDAFQKVDVPVLLVGQQHEQCYSLIHDDETAGYEIGKYVLSQGHRKIAFVGVTENDIAVGVKRKRGFQKAIQEEKECEVTYFETSFNLKEAIKKFPSIMEAYKPSIFVCATDNIALGILKAAQMEGLNVPRDLSITGFGGYEVTEVIHPGITTAKFFYQEAGELAAKKIVKLVNGEEVAKVTVSNFDIILRNSVDSLI
ncbi:LacI family DNA-binding transcriptional regulator [Metabacillus bambusae]|uniref:LacI family DNA-binding transcriptional regulator n=1 Tax=Metabacillus bambusae TaxID=2795218 RepID=A0ABS3N4M2_9BACI|nr:LacI family DNA-binding transcriptional regulator [Metabacillus bambusae]MBO1512995.1 LacI family DNA-binding transcriptional regulator [Metabacillus bambusae]